jgi:hypothetical protein
VQIGRADGAVVGSRTSSLLLTVGYTFRSRLPRPGRPAVPNHAACRGCSHQYRRSRLRLPPSPPRRYRRSDGRSHLHTDTSASWRTGTDTHRPLCSHCRHPAASSLHIHKRGARSPSWPNWRRGSKYASGTGGPTILSGARTPLHRERDCGDLAGALGDTLNSIINQAISSATTVGSFGLLAARYSGIGWMANLRDALSAPWGNAPTRPPIVRLVRAAPFGARVGCHVRGHWAAVRVGLSGAGVPRARRADGCGSAGHAAGRVDRPRHQLADPHVGDRPPPACTGGPAQHRQGGRVGCGGVYAPASLPLAPRLAAATAPGGARRPRSGMGGDESGAGLRVLSVTPAP